MTSTRAACLSGDCCKPQGLAETIYCVVNHSAIAPSVIAERVRKRVGYLIEAANPNRDDTKFQADLVGPITRATQNFALIEHLASECGGVFFRLPPSCPKGSMAPLHTALGVAAEAFGKQVQAVLAATADDVMTREEAIRIAETSAPLIAVVMQIVHVSKQKAGIPHDVYETVAR